jgi:formylmethanofuran dehydrogenase subunit E
MGKNTSILEKLIIQTYDRKPETIGNNNLLWVEVCKRLQNLYKIESIDDLYLSILKNELPSSHSLAAAISCVRKKYPQYEPTEEQKKIKNEVKQRYIENYRNS